MSKYQLVRDAIPLVLRLSAPAEREKLLPLIAAETGVPIERVSAMFDALLNSGIIEADDSDTAQTPGYTFHFDTLQSQRAMLRDDARMRRFCEAVERVVVPGATVIDVGAGSGILSLFAARAGAAKVYALEATDVADDATELAHENGFADRIQVVRGDAAVFTLDEPVDVVIGEWAGRFLVDEWRHFQAFAKARNRLLRPGGSVIPLAAQLYAVPVDDSRLYFDSGPGFWERPVGGFDFSVGRRRQLEHLRIVPVRAHPHTFLGEPWKLLNLNCRQDDSSAFFFENEHEVTLSHPGCVHGLVGFFNLDLAPGVHLDTSPSAAPTHWAQTYFPVERFAFQAQDLLSARMQSVQDPVTGAPIVRVSLKLMRGTDLILSSQYEYPLGVR